MFVRFAARLRDCDSRVAEGIFIVAYRLYANGELAAYERAQLEECIGWFEANLKVPHAHARACERAIYWFKASAQSHVRKMWELVWIVERHDVAISLVTTRRPGVIVYEDEHQVAAEPWTDLRRRLN